MLHTKRVAFTDQHGFPRRIVLRLDDAGTVPRFEQLRAQLAVMVAVLSVLTWVVLCFCVKERR